MNNWPNILHSPPFWAAYYSLRLGFEEDASFKRIADPVLDAYAEVDDLKDEVFAGNSPSELADLFSAEAADMEELLEEVKEGESPEAAATRILDEWGDEYGEDVDTVATKIRRAQAGDIPPYTSLEIAFAGGFTWTICFPPEAIVHTLRHPELGEGKDLYLGHDDGHFALPILRWEEIDLLAAAAPESSIVPPAVLPLLLFATAFVAPDDDQAEIRKRIADAWRQASIVDPKHAEVIAHALTYRTPHAWRRDSALGWISTSDYSTRNPTSRDRFAKHDGFKWMKRLMDAAESGRPLR